MATTTDRQCVGDGYLVGNVFTVPEDPAMYMPAGSPFVVGCNQFKCRLCGAMVRQILGYRDGPDASTRAKEIYADPDWTACKFLVPAADSRLYACQCSVVVVSKGQAAHMPNAAWACAGHPAPASGEMLPAMPRQTVNNFAVTVANAHLQGAVKVMALLFTDGNARRALPEHIGLGADCTMRVWTSEHQEAPLQLDFTKIAGACLQRADDSLQAFC